MLLLTAPLPPITQKICLRDGGLNYAHAWECLATDQMIVLFAWGRCPGPKFLPVGAISTLQGRE
jgi:hypothetical protein